MKRSIARLVIVLLLAAVLGCSKSGLPIVPVHGKVTFGGGPPPKPGTITFMPTKVAEGLPRRPGTASFGKNGEFQVTSFRKNDGLVPGTYSARVDCWKETPTLANPATFETYKLVPKDFEPPSVAVEADAGVVEVAIDVPKKK
jgi:hypothetical protein